MATESPLKMMKNVFYFTLNDLLFLRYLSFCLDLFFMYKNGLIRKIRLVLKFMTSQRGYQNNCNAHIANIPRSKGSQTMKSGQLIEYNLRNIFVEKSYTKCAAETIPRPLSKISKLSISLDQ